MHCASAIAIIVPRPFVYTMADRGMSGMTAAVALPCVGVQPRAASWNIFGDDRAARPWVRDVTFDEERSQVCSGSIPEVMAVFRNTAIGLMPWVGETNIAAACRRFAAQPWAALALIGIRPDN
jgi:hypothetical protein